MVDDLQCRTWNTYSCMASRATSALVIVIAITLSLKCLSVQWNQASGCLGKFILIL